MKNIPSTFITWCTVVSLTTLAVILSAHLGFFGYVLANDPTKISVLIAAVFACCSAIAGFQAWQIRPSNTVISKLWFGSHALVTLGMIGTVVGFLIMLGTAFENIDFTDVSTAQQALRDISLGMSTALLTTFLGLAGGLILQLQLLGFEHEQKE